MANKSAILEKWLSQYDLIVSKLPGVERKGTDLPYTSMNGNMYSMMRKDGTLGIRLSDEDREDFIKKISSRSF